MIHGLRTVTPNFINQKNVTLYELTAFSGAVPDLSSMRLQGFESVQYLYLAALAESD